MKKYWTACRENGDLIDVFNTYRDAENAIKEYEETDREFDAYTPDFYEVIEKETIMKMTRIKTETYNLDGDWMVDIQTTEDSYMAYLWHNKYGVKELIFGSAINQPNFRDFSYEEFLEMVAFDWTDYRDDYIEKYFDMDDANEYIEAQKEE